MVVYLAARYSRRDELRGYVEELTQEGIEVNARWVMADDHDLNAEDPIDESQRLAEEDRQDVEECDVLVNFTEEPNVKVPGRGRGGRHVELGLALALEKRVIVVGWRENVFHYLPEIEFYETWGEAKEAL